MSAHTPAPWYQTLTPHIVGKRDYFGEYHVIARCDISGAISSDEAAANARLIAAAPELLEALREMCDAPLVIDAPAGTVSNAARERSRAAYRKARAAIAKATGEG